MTLLKAALVLPAFASGLYVVQEKASDSRLRAQDPNLQVTTMTLSPAEADELTVRAPAQAETKSAALVALEKEVVARRLRIERVLTTLNHIAEVTSQMNPDRAASIEPVVVDLAEQTLELTAENAVMSGETDRALGDIEDDVKNLVDALAKTVEPEVSL